MLFFGQALAWCWHYGCVWFWQGKKSFSSPFALFPANLLMLHVVIWGHVSLYTLDFNSLMMAKSECLLIPSWEQPCPCVLSQIHKWHPLAFCHFQPLKKEKGIRGEGGTRSILTAHFLQCSNLGTSYTSSSLSKQGCAVTLLWNACLSSIGDQIQSQWKTRLQDSISRLYFVSYQASSII